MPLPREFYTGDTLAVARNLLGKRLVRRTEDGHTTAGVIVETEAYRGRLDPAAHSYKGPTERTRAMFGPKGHAYIYFIYGMHTCMNVTCGPPDSPDAVLLRALEPVCGIEIMEARRNTQNRKNLCSGPGKLCQAMAIHRGLYGLDLTEPGQLYIEDAEPVQDITASKRIGIDNTGEAKDYLWRFTVTGSGYVSVKPKG